MRVRPISHEDRLSIVDHLDELRSRLFACAAVAIIAFGICFWQNGHLINALNRALPPSAKTGIADQSHQDASLRRSFVEIEAGARRLAAALPAGSTQSQAVKDFAQTVAHASVGAIDSLPKNAGDQEKPITIGVSESFTTTLMVVGYFTLLLTIPMLLYQLYAFVIPALSKSERRIAIPVAFAAPILFLAGVVFTYFAILPPAVHFLQGYNSGKFQVLVQAKSYYKFEIMLLLGIGLTFEVPLLLLALQKAGLIRAQTLTVNWRYATVLIAVVAAALPGVDPVTMALEAAPLVFLYVLSIVLLHVVEYRAKRRPDSVQLDAL